MRSIASATASPVTSESCSGGAPPAQGGAAGRRGATGRPRPPTRGRCGRGRPSGARSPRRRPPAAPTSCRTSWVEAHSGSQRYGVPNRPRSSGRDDAGVSWSCASAIAVVSRRPPSPRGRASPLARRRFALESPLAARRGGRPRRHAGAAPTRSARGELRDEPLDRERPVARAGCARPGRWRGAPVRPARRRAASARRSAPRGRHVEDRFDARLGLAARVVRRGRSNARCGARSRRAGELPSA